MRTVAPSTELSDDLLKLPDLVQAILASFPNCGVTDLAVIADNVIERTPALRSGFTFPIAPVAQLPVSSSSYSRPADSSLQEQIN